MRCYAAYSKNELITEKSSSGAVFGELAMSILKNGGVVYGTAMSEDCYSAQIVRIDLIDNLPVILGSKYLQSQVGDAYISIEQDLKAGVEVLFSGTGCQVNGLRNYLKADYSNLLCVDVICHGVPSKKLWEAYLRELEKQQGKINKINFRNKKENWDHYGLSFDETFVPRLDSSYMRMFLNNCCLRPSCYECFAKTNKLSDITLGDFWGVRELLPKMYSARGTSAVIVRTQQGQKAFDLIAEQLNCEETTYENIIKYNPAEYSSMEKTSNRDDFYKELDELGLKAIEQRYAIKVKTSIIVWIKSKIKRCLNTLLK